MFLSTRFSTFFVAALDASINERQEADYVCDGVADDVTVEAAITALPANGGCVVLSTGTFTLANAIDAARDNVHVVGQGRNTLLNRDSGSAVIDAGTRTGWLVENLRTDGGTVDVSAATTSAKIFVWEGATFVSQVFAGGTIDAPLNLSHVNAGTFNIILGRVVGDTFDRVDLRTGQLGFGPGTAAVDTEWIRGGVNLWRTPDALAFTTGILTLANGDNNDISVIDTGVLHRIAGPTGAFVITGLDTAKVSGRYLILYNSTAQNMTIANQSASSASGNRITTMTGADVLIPGEGFAVLVYDVAPTPDVWLLVSVSKNVDRVELGVGGSAPDTLLVRGSAGQLDLRHASSPAFNLRVTGDAQVTAQLNINSLSFGSGGATPPDTILARASANTWEVPADSWLWGTIGLTLGNGNNNDVALLSGVFYRITGPTGTFNISGFDSPQSGRILIVFNSTAQDMTILNESINSVAANRILTLTGADVTLTGISAARFIYSGVDSRWILLGTQG